MGKPKPKNNVVQLTRKRKNLDGWNNALTGIGNSLSDKRAGRTFASGAITEEDAEELWRGDDMAARAIETVPDEIVRAGFKLQIEPETDAADAEEPEDDQDEDEPVIPSKAPRELGRRDLAASVFPDDGEQSALEDGKETADAMKAFFDELDLDTVILEAMWYARAYGGSGILLGVRDGASDLSRPLELEKVRSLEWLTVLQPRELVPVRWYSDPRKAKYGEPEIYELYRETTGGVTRPSNVRVHESRIIRFDGVVVSRRQKRQQRSWGDSVLVRMEEVLQDFQQSWQGAGILLQDFAQAVFKIKGLTEALTASDPDQGTAAVVQRAKQIEMSRSIARAVLIDAEEEFERKTTNVSGLPDMLDRFCNRLAAAARMPVTVLMGQAPAGLNATGASDIRWFYDASAAYRNRVVRKRLNRIAQVAFAAKEGPTKGKEPARWSWVFGPMWELDELQTADKRLKNAQADVAYVNAGVLQPEEVAASRFGGDEYGEQIVLDRRIREEADVQAEEEAKAEAEALQKMAKAGGAQTSAPGKGGKPFNPSSGRVKSDGDTFRVDYDPDQPRDEQGQWGEGGAGTASLKTASLKEIQAKLHRIMGNKSNPAADDPEYKAIVTELKTRKIKSFTALERAIRAGK